MSPVACVARGFGVLLSLVLASVLVTVALAPVLQWGLRASGLVEPDYPEVVFRTLQLSAIALTAGALALYGTPGRPGWGLDLAPGAPRRALSGFLAGAAALAAVALVLYLTDVRTLRYDLETAPWYWIAVVARAFIAATVIAVVEELWFRGGLFTLLRCSGGVGVAVWMSSLLYGITHFIDRHALPASGAQDWYEAAQMLAASGHDILRLQNLDSFLALVAAGLWLAALRRRHSDIIAAITLHMGFVVVIKVFKKLTYIEPHASARWLAGVYDDMIGWLAFAVLLVLAAAAWRKVGVEREAPA